MPNSPISAQFGPRHASPETDSRVQAASGKANNQVPTTRRPEVLVDKSKETRANTGNARACALIGLRTRLSKARTILTLTNQRSLLYITLPGRVIALGFCALIDKSLIGLRVVIVYTTANV